MNFLIEDAIALHLLLGLLIRVVPFLSRKLLPCCISTTPWACVHVSNQIFICHAMLCQTVALTLLHEESWYRDCLVI